MAVLLQHDNYFGFVNTKALLNWRWFISSISLCDMKLKVPVTTFGTLKFLRPSTLQLAKRNRKMHDVTP